MAVLYHSMSVCVYAVPYYEYVRVAAQINPNVLKQLVEKIREDIGSVDEDSIKTHFTNTLEHLKKATQDL